MERETKEFTVVLKNGVVFTVKANTFETLKRREDKNNGIVVELPEEFAFDTTPVKSNILYLPISEVSAIFSSEAGSFSFIVK